LRLTVRPALDAFVANARFLDVNDDHGEVLSELVTLIDSSGENVRHLGTVQTLLANYGPGHHAYWDMMGATNGVFTVLFRGHYIDAFGPAVEADPSILAALQDFIDDNSAEADTDNEYLIANAAAELARF